VVRRPCRIHLSSVGVSLKLIFSMLGPCARTQPKIRIDFRGQILVGSCQMLSKSKKSKMANELTSELTAKSSSCTTQKLHYGKKSSAGFIGSQIYELMRERTCQ
jgi:hypothetical protein